MNDTIAFTPGRKKSALIELEVLLQRVRDMPTTTPCVACGHFDGGVCGRWKARPPSNILADGCDEFTEQVPF